jgi:hypothetical protein
VKGYYSCGCASDAVRHRQDCTEWRNILTTLGVARLTLTPGILAALNRVISAAPRYLESGQYLAAAIAAAQKEVT